MLPALIPIALQLAGQFAPEVLKHFGVGDSAASVAGKVIDIATTLTGAPDGEAALVALKGNPELAAKYRSELLAADLEMERMTFADRQGARDRDVKLAQAGQRNYRADVLAACAVLLVLFCLLVVVWKADMNEFAKGGITLILGRALGWVEQIFSFEYGTNRTNKAKDDTINRLTK